MPPRSPHPSPMWHSVCDLCKRPPLGRPRTQRCPRRCRRRCAARGASARRAASPVLREMTITVAREPTRRAASRDCVLRDNGVRGAGELHHLRVHHLRYVFVLGGSEPRPAVAQHDKVSCEALSHLLPIAGTRSASTMAAVQGWSPRMGTVLRGPCAASDRNSTGNWAPPSCRHTPSHERSAHRQEP